MAFQEWVDLFNYNGNTYPLASMQQTLTGNVEEIRNNYAGYVGGAYQANGVVFACMLVRMLHFTEARFQFRQIRQGRPGNLFGTQELGVLETPWPNGTTGDLLARMIQDADLAGNSYTLRQGDTLVRLRPDWTQILLGSRSGRTDFKPGDPDMEITGYVYQPGGKGGGRDPILYDVQDVAHFAPIPDPSAAYRGMSWLSTVVPEVQSDKAMTQHKLKFLQQGATVNLVVTTPEMNKENFDRLVQVIRENHEGVANAYRTMVLSSGADVKAMGSNLQQMDFRAVQGAGEVRIASAARVPPVLLGLSEGLQGSTLNSGNYQASRRMFADGCIRPMWRQACGALATILTVPGGADLWYDDRDISFLKEDLKDIAEVQQMEAASLRQLIDSGFDPTSAVEAIVSNDWTLLEHSGLFSVQLQQPGSAQTKPTLQGLLVPDTGGTVAPTNGKQPTPAVG
jgi:hypothetical protein